MMRIRFPKRRLTTALAASLALTSLGANVGDVMYVNRVSLPIRNGKFAFNKVVATAVQGDSLTVTALEGTWLKVKFVPPGEDAAKAAPAVEGYVMEEALSARQVAAASGGAAGSASSVASAGAGRGFSALLNSGKYAAAKGLNPDPFYKMVTESREAVTPEAFDAFDKGAKIGPYKPTNVAEAQ
jgi:hypothetical protein